MALQPSHDVPHIFSRMAEFTARYAGGKCEVADRDLLVNQFVGESVSALGHGTDKDAYALLGLNGLDVVPHTGQGGIEAQRHLATVGGGGVE